MLGNTLEHVAKIGVRIKTAKFGRAYQAVDRGRPLTAAVRSSEQITLAAERHGAQRPFGRVVVDLDAPVVAIAHQGGSARQRVANRSGELGLFREPR